MSQTKYKELCEALDRIARTSLNFETQFIETFAAFMGCDKDSITINIDTETFTLAPLTFKANLLLSIKTAFTHMDIPVNNISFIFHQDKAPKYQYQISYGGQSGFFEQDLKSVFSAISATIQKRLIHEEV